MSCCPEHQDHHAMMSGPQAEGDFLRRFFVVTFLLVPLALLTPAALNFLGFADFALRIYLQFGVASIIFYFSLVFFEHARHEIKMRQYGMMTLVSLAVGAGYLFSAASTFLPQLEAEFYLEISTLVWILLFGHYLEARSSAAAGDALSEVAKLLPSKAHRLRDGHVADVDLGELNEGDIVLVKPGEKVPADGVIIKGQANTDESLISGESKPVAKKDSDKVVAGSICLDGSLEVRLERVGESSTIGQIQKLIAAAQQTKPRAQKLADRAASFLTFAAVSVAVITILVWAVLLGQPFVFALTLAITVLVIACPHALGLAIPTVSTIATSLAVKNGVFLKDLGKLEVVKDVDYVVMDKTGTLTRGKFTVTDVLNVKTQNSKLKSTSQTPNLTREQKDTLQIAASLEQHSSHFIGQSIVRYAQEQGVETAAVSDFKNIAGKGVSGVLDGQRYYLGNQALMEVYSIRPTTVSEVEKKLSAQGKTVIYLANESEVIGVLALADQIKPESFQAVENLHQLGVKVAMLTGDNQQVAQSVAEELKIDSYFADVLPEDKYKIVKALQEGKSGIENWKLKIENSRRRRVVMMVGDGVNDAPALTQASVGVAIGAGTDVAVEAGDVVLTRSNPEDIARLVVLSRKVFRKMVENLLWATGYNVVAIPAAAGIFAPWGFFLDPKIGALLMALSSIIVVINALTLRRLRL